MAQAEPQTGRVKGERRSIVHYLIALALVSVVPSFLFAGVLIQRNQVAQEDTLQTLVVATSRSIIQAIDREIAANTTTLRVLAASPWLRRGDFRAFYDNTKFALDGTAANLFVVNPDYTTFASTRRPFDSPTVTISDVEAAERAFETDKVVVTDLAFGVVSQQWIYNILLPVDLGNFGRKLIALNQGANNFATALSANTLPDGWNTALLDNRGVIVAASPGVGAVGEAFTAFDALQQPLSPRWQQVDTGAGPVISAIQRSGVTGWRVVAWAPVWNIAQPVLITLASLIAGGLVLLGLILGALFWFSRRIGTSVRGLARDARRLGAGEPVVATAYPVSELAEVSTALMQASQDRQAADSDVRFLMREVAHRSKNQMTVIAAMARQTARGAADVASYVTAFERRIFGLARSTDLLLAHGRTGVALRELIESHIAPFAPPDVRRTKLVGPLVRLNAQAAQILGMAAHELATNAAKYGAFSGDEGTLLVEWRRDGERLDLIWRETGGQPLPDSGRVGFGTTVLKTMVGKSLGAGVERIGHADGIEWRFAIPLVAIDPDRTQPPVGEDAADE